MIREALLIAFIGWHANRPRYCDAKKTAKEF